MPPLDNAPVNEETGGNKIPAAVRRAAARAQQLHEEVTGTAPAAEVEEPAVVEAAPPAPAAPAEPPAVDWEQRYKTLQGKYDSELPQLRGQVEGLQQVLSTLQQAPAPAAPTAPVTTTTVVDPADVETYGEELITSARRWARAEIEPQLVAMRAELDAFKSDQTKFRANSVQERTNAALDADPEIGTRWRELNNDPQFLLWCEGIDPFFGAKRLAGLQDAYSRGDAARTARFFKSYIAEHTAVTEPAADQPGQTPPSAVVAARPQLADLAAPGRVAAPPAPSGAPADKRIWTNRDISAFYRDRQKGVFTGREEEASRLEIDIIAAAREGRIR